MRNDDIDLDLIPEGDDVFDDQQQEQYWHEAMVADKIVVALESFLVISSVMIAFYMFDHDLARMLAWIHIPLLILVGVKHRQFKKKYNKRLDLYSLYNE